MGDAMTESECDQGQPLGRGGVMSPALDPAGLGTPTAGYGAGFWVPLRRAALALALATVGLLLAGIPLLYYNVLAILVTALTWSVLGLGLALVGVLLCLDALRDIGAK